MLLLTVYYTQGGIIPWNFEVQLVLKETFVSRPILFSTLLKTLFLFKYF